jgi:hypothetical protein
MTFSLAGHTGWSQQKKTGPDVQRVKQMMHQFLCVCVCVCVGGQSCSATSNVESSNKNRFIIHFLMIADYTHFCYVARVTKICMLNMHHTVLTELRFLSGKPSTQLLRGKWGQANCGLLCPRQEQQPAWCQSAPKYWCCTYNKDPSSNEGGSWDVAHACHSPVYFLLDSVYPPPPPYIVIS